MGISRVHTRIVNGRAGSWAAPLRGLLRLAEIPYAAAVSRRNGLCDASGPRLRLPVPVISVGNITVGGTGKTPFVIKLVELLNDLGRRPAVVARGYKSRGGQPNDEELLIRRRCDGVIYVANADRCAAAMEAHEGHGADAIVLDDGFQHRALGRDLDIVLIDATCPFGFEHLLPRGLLREPVASLSRAHAVVLTRYDQVSDLDRREVVRRIRGLVPDTPIFFCRHRIESIEPLQGAGSSLQPSSEWRGERVVLFAGIARPEAFARTVEERGVRTVGAHWFPDHHAYRPADISQLIRRFPDHEMLLTTEKDAVKLSTMALPDARIAFVKISIDFEPEGDTMLRTLVSAALGRHAS